MKFSFVTGLLAVAVSSVAAAPMKWILVTKHVQAQPASAIRVGLVMPNAPVMPQRLPADLSKSPVRPYRHRQGCVGKMRAKAVDLSNKLRTVLGLPPHISLSEMNERTRVHGIWHHGPPYHRQHHHMHNGHHVAPFTARLTHSLNNLGKWEGRAVAFVIGCGLGVLLRIVYVFAVLISRSVRGRSDDEETQTVEYVVFEADAPAPPSYLSAEEEKEQLKVAEA